MRQTFRANRMMIYFQNTKIYRIKLHNNYLRHLIHFKTDPTLINEENPFGKLPLSVINQGISMLK
jgi:hypothetical protein